MACVLLNYPLRSYIWGSFLYSMANQYLSQTQTMKQSQVLAPQLRQSLEMLQVPILELRALIEQGFRCLAYSRDSVLYRDALAAGIAGLR